ncbi:hypothetical protein AusDCA_3130 [Desulfitobacterium sp. AusDCA]
MLSPSLGDYLEDISNKLKVALPCVSKAFLKLSC